MYRAPTSGFLRIPYVQRCELDAGAGWRSALTCNLSVLGLYVHLELPPRVATEVSVRFHLPDGGAPVLASATITWSNEDPPERIVDLPVGCGLRFTGMAPEDRGRVERLVAEFVRDPKPAAGLSQPRSGRRRISFVAGCTLLTGAGVVDGTVCNLSEAGLYVATRATLAPDERLVVSFALPGFDGSFARRVRVAWTNPELPAALHALPPGYGLELLDLSAFDREVLAAAIVDYLGQLPPPGA